MHLHGYNVHGDVSVLCADRSQFDHSALLSPALGAGVVTVRMHRAVFFCQVVSRGCLLQKSVYWASAVNMCPDAVASVRGYHPYGLWGFMSFLFGRKLIFKVKEIII